MTAVPQPPAAELLDQLDALRAAATPGTWWNESGTVHAPFPFGRNDGEPGPACHPLDAQGGNGRDADADAELAAEAVNALPRLVAALRGVLARHVPQRSDPGWCDDDGASWPCRTLRDIAAALTDGTPR